MGIAFVPIQMAFPVHFHESLKFQIPLLLVCPNIKVQEQQQTTFFFLSPHQMVEVAGAAPEDTLGLGTLEIENQKCTGWSKNYCSMPIALQIHTVL